MELEKNDFLIGLRPVAVLTIISITSAVSLGLIHNLTEEKIIESEQQQVNNALSKIFPQADNLKEVENQVYRAVKDGETIGYVGIKEGRGYGGFTGGLIKLAVGINTEGEIARVRIIRQSETPGLGSRITKKDFLNQFDGIPTSENLIFLELERNNGRVEAITGATISSQAVVDIVREKVEELRGYS